MRFTRLTQWKFDVYIKISVHYRYLKFVQHFNAQLSPLTQRTYPTLALSWGVLRNLQCQGGRCNSMRRGKSIGLHYIPCFIISVDCPFVFLGGFWRFLPSPAGKSICQRAEMLLVVAYLPRTIWWLFQSFLPILQWPLYGSRNCILCKECSWHCTCSKHSVVSNICFLLRTRTLALSQHSVPKKHLPLVLKQLLYFLQRCTLALS